MFLNWTKLIFHENMDTQFSEAEWLAMDPSELEDYRMNPANNLATFVPIIHPATNNNHGTVRIPQSAVSEFKKSIKRDLASYPTLKDQKHWNSWNRAMIAQARTHNVSEVFDRNYVPLATNVEDVELFQQKQGFIYTVQNTKGIRPST